MPIHIAPLTHADLEGAITCIQRAFENDPYFLWAFPDRTRFSVARNRASLRSRCVWGMNHALFHIAKDTDSADTQPVLGVACWLPPGLASPMPATPGWTAYIRSWISAEAWTSWTSTQYSAWSLWTNQLATNIRYLGRGGLSVRRYYLWKEAQAEAQTKLWDDPQGYYFCNIVTVSPEAQGKGVGKKLMEVVLKMADQEGRKCYLESSRDEPNVPIYERMGFKLVGEFQCKDGEDDKGIMLYCMMREPRVSM